MKLYCIFKYAEYLDILQNISELPIVFFSIRLLFLL